MVPAAKQIKVDPWRNPDHLSDFLDELRSQGYQVGPNEYATSQDVVLGLIARGEDISRPETLIPYLAPVVCSNPREQHLFAAHFNRWVERRSKLNPQIKPGPGPNRLLAEVARGWRSWRRIWAGVGVLGTAFAIFLWRYSAGLSPEPGPVNQGPLMQVPAPGTPTEHFHLITGLEVVGIALAITAMAWGIWWYYRSRLFLTRDVSSEEPDLVAVALDPKLDESLDRRLLARAARELRRRYPVESDNLDIPCTVEATARHLGEFTPVRRVRYVSPEYLVLIDRRHLRDENAQYIDEMILRLQRNQVYMERYYFDRDPRMLYPAASRGQAVSLREVAALHKDHRLLLFSDAAALFDPTTGELAHWTEPLWSFPRVGLFTSKPVETWGFRETEISKAAQVVAARPEGILHFARQIHKARKSPLRADTVSSPFPAVLSSRATYWLNRESPPAEEVESMLSSVRRYLGADGFFWLSACAVYPGVKFNLTLYLGSNLHNEAGEPLFSGERLSQLLRLPWLQQAYMPDWLRVELVKRLSKRQAKEVRKTLDRLWLSVSAGSDKPIELEIARRHPMVMRLLARKVFGAAIRKAGPNSPLHDYVFARVMLGRSVEPLAVRIPRLWRKLLKARAEERAIARREPLIQKVVRRVIFGLAILSSVAVLGGLLLHLSDASSDINFVALLAQGGVAVIIIALGSVWLDRKLILLGMVFLGAACGTFGIFFWTGRGDRFGGFDTRLIVLIGTEVVCLVAPIAIQLVPRLAQGEPLNPWRFRTIRYLFATLAASFLLAPLVPMTMWDSAERGGALVCLFFVLSSAQGCIGALLESRPLVLHAGAPFLFVVGAFAIPASHGTKSVAIAAACLWALGAAVLSIWAWLRMREPADGMKAIYRLQNSV